jgi:SOS response regulatory protein OraA/RecX
LNALQLLCDETRKSKDTKKEITRWKNKHKIGEMLSNHGFKKYQDEGSVKPAVATRAAVCKSAKTDGKRTTKISVRESSN